MDDNKPKLISLMDFAQDLITLAQMPLFPSKHSKKTFTNHQLFKLSILRAYHGMDYRRFEDYLKTSSIPKYLELKRIPHFTTLQKFEQRQNIQNIEQMLLKFVDLAPKKIKEVGLDATGFSMIYASRHYEKRVGRVISKKDFLKSNLFFDLRNLLILAIKTRKQSRHDTKDVKPIWNKIKNLDFNKVFADKAYDANWFHQLIFESGRKSMIHIKSEDTPIWRTHGEFRKKAKRLAKNEEKGKRSLCETINSVIKRVFGSIIRAKNLGTQKIELLFKIIAYNIERIYKLTKNIFLQIFFFLYFLEKVQKNIFEFTSFNL